MKKIDAHTHLGYNGFPFNVGNTLEEFISQMDEFEVEKSFCSNSENKLVEDAVKKYPERIVGQAWEDPYKGQAAVDHLRYTVMELGFKTLKLHPLVNAFLPYDPMVFPLIEEAQSLNIPVFVHSGHAPFSLPWQIGQLAEIFPGVRFVLIHMGHGNGMYIQGAIDVAKKLPNVYLETSGMPMHTKIKEAFDTLGDDKVMYGSDVPFHHPSVELQRMKCAGLTDAQMQKLLYDNAARFC